ncbi:class I mannose-6-phosphate isomerase [Tunicatimonas pelagia]|uniref:class I mannose-6-phosphate isomerase n=1 Tax=Tunicatimonas pelagia TaxID=931531 RepID=UPI002666785D|nr:class I mannose-6-phosphate isomerase [Tunicatimonas pelagia]WKN44937.1 class I mannose-6-phosphate isomerase [Tunicatimonas pelagia]
MTIPTIISLTPNRVWRTYLGGKMLDIREGKAEPQDSHFPEDWIASTTRAVNQGREEHTEEGLSRVEVDGEPHLLTELLSAHPHKLVGPAHYAQYGAKTQFLLKFLDSSIRLHIQAHPTVAFSQQHLNSNHGKTEAYVILAVRPEVEPYIFLGFQHPRPREEFKRAVAGQDIATLESCFDKITVQPGDVFIVPGGMPHAIGPGVLMIEIMEPTDFVARLEFERGGYVLPEAARFMDRGIDFGMDMIEFKETSVEEIKAHYFCSPRMLNQQRGGEEYVLIDTEQTACFRVHRLRVSGSCEKRADSFYVGIVTGGSGTLRAGDQELAVQTGDRFMIPFATETVTYQADEPLEVVLAFPPRTGVTSS